MTISLTPEMEMLIEQKVQSGRFKSADEVVSAGLRLLDSEEHLRNEIGKGVDDIETGRYFDAEDEAGLSPFFEDIKKRGRERLQITTPAKI